MTEDTSLTEDVLRRDRWIVTVGLAVIALLSWAYVLSGTGMSALGTASASFFPHPMAEMAVDGMATQPAAWTTAYSVIMLLMWWVMMIAMMTPSIAPMILLYARVTRHAQAQGRLEPGAVPTAAFAGGYLMAWLNFSLFATILHWGLERSGVVSTTIMGSTSAVLSAGILIFAGLYQLSPLKHMCLTLCRDPAAFLSRHWRPGASGALRMGLRHGFFCIGCCWVLMTLLFVGGIMNVFWIAVLALFVLLEKLAPYGPWLARASGILLTAWGVAILAV